MRKYLIIALAALFGLVACNKEPEINAPVNQGGDVVLTFTSLKPQFDALTKTEWDPGSNSIIWSEGDKIRVGYTLNGDWMGKSSAGAPKFYASESVVINNSDKNLGTFEVPVTFDNTDPDSEADYNFYGFYPSSAGVGDADAVSSGGIATLKLPTSQTPGAATFDKASDIMIGKTATIHRKGLPTDPIEISWTRLVAHADLTFSNLAVDGTETISEITLTSSGKFAGPFSVNLSSGAVNTEDAGNEIKINGDYQVSDGSNVEVWCSVLPGTFTSLGVVIKTNKATYTKNFTGIANKAFKQNARNRLAISMSGADRVEVLAKEYSLYSGALTEGDYIIYDAGHAMKAEISSNRFAYVAIAPVNDVISTNDETILWHIAPSATTGYYTIYNQSVQKYASATGSKNQGALLDGVTDDKSLWSVDGEYDFLNKARAAASSDPTNKYLRSNGDLGFACYANGTGNTLKLYKYDSRTPLNAPTSVTAKLNSTIPNAIDVTFDDKVTDADTYVITATPTAGGDAVIKSGVAASPATIEGLAYNTEYSISVYAVPASTDTDHKQSPATSAASIVTTGPKPASPEGYELITSIGDVTTGLYIIAAKIGDDYIGMPNTLGTSPFAGTALTVAEGLVTTSNASGFSLTITKSDNKYSIAGASSTLGYGSSTNFSTSATGNAALWTISAGTKGSFRIANVGTTNRAVVYRVGTTNKFGAYATSNITAAGTEYYDVELFKFNGTVKSNPTTTVTPASPIDLEVGDTQQLTVSTDSDGAKSYESDDETVATVTSSGLIEAKATGSATITVTTAETTNFNEGTTTITVNVSDGPSTVADALAAPGSYAINNVLVYAKTTSALILGDATGKIYAYKSSHGLSVGDLRSISGTTKWYNGVYEYDSPSITGTGTDTVNHGTAVEFDNEYSSLQTNLAPGSGSDPGSSAVYIHAIGSQSGRKITTSNSELYLAASDNTHDGETVEVYGYVYAYNTTNTNFNFVAVSIEEYVDPNAPALSVSPATTSSDPAAWAADNDDDKVFTVTATNGTWSITNQSTVTSWADVSVSPSDNTITVKPKEKQAADAHSGSITITLEPSHSGYSNLTQTIYLSQAKYTGGGNPEPVDKTYSFAFATMGSTGWSNGYADHDNVYNDSYVSISIKSASKQTGTITDYPVTKAGDVIVILKDGTMSAVTFNLTQWTTKAKTVSLQYSTDGGSTFSAMDPAVSSSNFTLSSASLPTGTNAVKMVQGNTGNQVGITGVSFTYTPSN